MCVVQSFKEKVLQKATFLKTVFMYFRWGMTADNIIYDHLYYINGGNTMVIKRNECDDLHSQNGFTKVGQWIYYVR